MPGGMRLLEVTGLAAGYNGTPALRDVTFAAERGTRDRGAGAQRRGQDDVLPGVAGGAARKRRERRAGRPLRHGPADGALAPGLSGQRAGRGADGRAATIGMVAAARTGRAAHGAGGACDRGSGRGRTRDVRRALRGTAPARADRACAGPGGRPVAARRAVLGPRRPQLGPPDGIDRRPRAAKDGA